MGLNPSNVIYVSPVPNAGQFGLEVTELAAHIRLIREQLRRQIEKSNMRADRHHHRVVFNEGDLIWVHLKKERFPLGKWHKIHQWRIGRWKVLKRINDNAYRLEQPADLNISNVFNVADLMPSLEVEKQEENQGWQ